MAKSTFLEAAILNHVLRGVAMPSLSTLWIALYTTLPDEDNTGGVEVSGGSYARVSIARNTGNWTAPASGFGLSLVQNVDVLQFPVPTANWGVVVGTGLLTASSGGNLLYVTPLLTARTINNGDPAPRFDSGALLVEEA